MENIVRYYPLTLAFIFSLSGHSIKPYTSMTSNPRPPELLQLQPSQFGFLEAGCALRPLLPPPGKVVMRSLSSRQMRIQALELGG